MVSEMAPPALVATPRERGLMPPQTFGSDHTTWYVLLSLQQGGQTTVQLRARSPRSAIERAENLTTHRALAVFTEHEWRQATGRLVDAYCVIIAGPTPEEDPF